MEQWKRNDPSLRVRDLEEDVIIMSDNEEEVEAPPSSGGSYRAPPLAECIGPVVTCHHGQFSTHLFPNIIPSFSHNFPTRCKTRQTKCNTLYRVNRFIGLQTRSMTSPKTL